MLGDDIVILYGLDYHPPSYPDISSASHVSLQYTGMWTVKTTMQTYAQNTLQFKSLFTTFVPKNELVLNYLISWRMTFILIYKYRNSRQRNGLYKLTPILYFNGAGNRDKKHDSSQCLTPKKGKKGGTPNPVLSMCIGCN